MDDDQQDSDREARLYTCTLTDILLQELANEERHGRLASEHGIDPEFTDPPFDRTLLKVVINKDEKQAAAFAEKLMEVDVGENRPRIVLFSDGSKGNRKKSVCSTGIAYKVCRGAHSDWMFSSAAVVGKCDTTQAEITAINMALDLAATELEKETRQSPTGDMETNDVSSRRTEGSADDNLSKIYVLSDSQSGLQWVDLHLKAKVFLRRERTAEYLSHPCFQEMARQLRRLSMLKARLEIHWIKGHSGITGKEIADNFATRAAQRYMWENDTLPAADSQCQVIPMSREIARERRVAILLSYQERSHSGQTRESTPDPGQEKDEEEDENPIPPKKPRLE